jgi:archaellum component FlaC
MNNPTKIYFFELQRKLEKIKEDIETFSIEVSDISNDADDMLEQIPQDARLTPSGQKLLKEVNSLEGIYESLKVCTESIGITLKTIEGI